MASKQPLANARRYLTIGTALGTSVMASGAAFAQESTAPAASSATSSETQSQGGLQEIVVTAQRREQRLQDVPIAITAITQNALSANRVVNVSDLSGLAPNVVVRASAGGSGIPSFSSRGLVSYGVVPGSDKEFSIYLDGVYISSSRASLFDLPDIERIEVLRGPQGTLFGRNATTGAVSIVTREPSGTFAAHQDLSYGNYDYFRSRTSLDLPSWGPFSAYGSYVHNERRGDIRNSGAGAVWDRTGPNTNVGRQVSPKYLGSHNSEAFFGSIKFEPSDSFSTVYKFDRTDDDFTPDGQAAIGINPNAPLVGSLLSALVNSQATPVQFATDGKRPKVVNNSFAVPGRQRNLGHSLTSKLIVSDSLSFKNIAAYRSSFITSASQLDGLGGLIFTPQAVVPAATLAAFSTLPPAQAVNAIPNFAAFFGTQVGTRYQAFVTNAQARGQQWSDELQANYESDLLTLTVGALYFHQKDRAGGPPGIKNTFTFMNFPTSGRIPLGNEGTSYNKGTSIAAYTQAEFHVTDQVDLIGGVRLTRDKKSGRYVSGGTFVPATPGSFTDGTFINQQVFPFTYRKTKPSYSIGANYKPNNDVLVYAKYSTAFVSGGSVGGIAFEPETVKSAEAGFKADLLDRRLRTNVSVFHAKYRNVQSAQSGANISPPRNELGTLIISQGDVRAQGFELEVTAAPVEGLTLNGSFGYTDVKFGAVNPILLNSQGGRYVPTLIPKYTYTVSGQYETDPLFGDATLFFRADANGRARQRTLPNPDYGTLIPSFRAVVFSPASVVVNTRVALRHLKFGPVETELAVWARNLNNNKATSFPLALGNIAASAQFQPARTYGLDLSVSF